MSYVVYADVMLVWIFIVNYLTYYITCKLIKQQLSQTKLFMWSFISSIFLELVYISFIYTNNKFLKIVYILLNFFIYFLFIKFIIKKKNNTYIIRMLCYNIIGTLILAGIFMIFINKMPHVKILIPITAAICLAIPFIIKLCDAKKSQNLYQVQVHTKHKVINTYGYLDTGNTLIDVYSNKPVIILDYRLIKEFISEKDESSLIKYIKTGNYQYIASLLIDNELLHPICYKTISNDFSIMPGFKLKRLVLDKKYIYKNVIAAISQNKLSDSNDYMVLLNNNL